MKRLLTIVIAGVILLGLPLAAKAEIMHWPTEVTYYNPATAYAGVTLFASQQAPADKAYVYLVDMDGYLVHKVKAPHGISPYAHLLENGNFLTNGSYLGSSTKYLTEFDWNGNIVRSLTIAQNIHHDYKKFWNKKLNAYTYMFIARSSSYTAAQATALGALGTTAVWDADTIVEMDMNGSVVWQWSMTDHLCQNSSSSLPNYYADVASAPGRLDINVQWWNQGVIRYVPGADWTHFNSFDYNPDLGLVAMNSRNMNEFFVVDHDKTFVSTTDYSLNIAATAGSAGDFTYRFGSPSNYNQGGRPVFADNVTTQVWGQHNIQWIKPTMWEGGPALPGAGNLILFDNHQSNDNPLGGYSRLVEINPYVTGPKVGTAYPTSPTYVNPPLAGYTRQNTSSGTGFGQENVSNQIVWNFKPAFGNSFASAHISGVQRLPNGNTLGCAGEQGHFLEVTSAGALAWEYSNPILGTTGVAYKFMENQGTNSNFQVFRAYRYSVLYPGLSNRVRMLSDGRILPVVLGVPGVGSTLTGAKPCRSIPCTYWNPTGTGSNSF